jgi:hypothetical protein
MWKWVRRFVLIVMAGFVLLYFGDWAVYKVSGSPQGKITVNRTISVPLKGNRTEVDYLGTSDVPCSISLFPQDGESPCWKLARNRNQNTTM